jgi:hypothetical protein
VSLLLADASVLTLGKVEISSYPSTDFSGRKLQLAKSLAVMRNELRLNTTLQSLVVGD